MNRCVIFPRSDQVQALVELATLDDAIRVKTTLDGRWLHDVSPGASIYPGVIATMAIGVNMATAVGCIFVNIHASGLALQQGGRRPPGTVGGAHLAD